MSTLGLSEQRRKSRTVSLFPSPQSSVLCLFHFPRNIRLYKYISQRNEVIAVADVAITLVGPFLTSAVVGDVVCCYLPSHLYSTKVHSGPLPHTQRHSERWDIKQRCCCVLWDSRTASCLFNFYVRILLVEHTYGSERFHLTNLGDTTAHISTTAQSPATVSTTQGRNAPTNSAACSTREVRQRGLQLVSPH